MKKLIGTSVPFLFFHLICCGSLFFFFTASGYLLIVRQEGRNKFFLIPAVVIGGLLMYFFHHHQKCCQQKEFKTWSDHLLSVILYLSFSLIIGFAFMIYVFIPWWIPNYTGGFLLP